MMFAGWCCGVGFCLLVLLVAGGGLVLGFWCLCLCVLFMCF